MLASATRSMKSQYLSGLESAFHFPSTLLPPAASTTCWFNLQMLCPLFLSLYRTFCILLWSVYGGDLRCSSSRFVGSTTGMRTVKSRGRQRCRWPLWRLWILIIHRETLQCSVKLLVASEDLRETYRSRMEIPKARDSVPHWTTKC